MEETEIENANFVDRTQKKKRVLEDKGRAFYVAVLTFLAFVFIFKVKSLCTRSFKLTTISLLHIVVRRRLLRALRSYWKLQKNRNKFLDVSLGERRVI